EGNSVAVSDPSDCFEREADSVAEQVMTESYGVESPAPTSTGNSAVDAGGAATVQREEDDDGWLSSLGDLVESAGSAVASGAGAVWDAGNAAVGDVGSAIASGAETAWDVGSSAVSDVGSTIASGAKGVASDVADVGEPFSYVDLEISHPNDAAEREAREI